MFGIDVQNEANSIERKMNEALAREMERTISMQTSSPEAPGDSAPSGAAETHLEANFTMWLSVHHAQVEAVPSPIRMGENELF